MALTIIVVLLLIWGLIPTGTGSTGWGSPRYDNYKQSYLSASGYKVGKSGMSKAQRQALLNSLVSNGYVTKGYVVDQLQKNISMFQCRPNMDNAVNDWLEDLRYVQRNM